MGKYFFFQTSPYYWVSDRVPALSVNRLPSLCRFGWKRSSFEPVPLERTRLLTSPVLSSQRFSAYLPLSRAPRSSRSVSVTKEGPRSPKSGGSKSDRAGSANQTSKRRSTMNSREAAYDEEEQLRRAIEASKELVTVPDDGTSRRTKRHRSDSEEYVYPCATV